MTMYTIYTNCTTVTKMCFYTGKQFYNFPFIQCALVVPKDGIAVEEYGEHVSVGTQDGIAVVQELLILFAW